MRVRDKKYLGKLMLRGAAVVAAAALIFGVVFGITACRRTSDLERIARGLTTYTIVAELNASDMSITATQRVDFVNTYSVELTDLAFHLFGNAFREGARFGPVEPADVARAYPNGPDFGSLTVTSVRVGGNAVGVNIAGQDDDILMVDFGRNLMPGSSISIELEWRLVLANVRHRLGFVDNTINLGNFFPIAAMRHEGAWSATPYYSIGDPFFTEVANFDVSITVPSNMVVASSGCRVSVTDIDGGRSTHRKRARAVRDFAMVMSPDFQIRTAKIDGIEVRYYYIIDAEPDQSLQISVDAVRTFNELFGAYPYPTLSVVETNFLHGGMEYPRLVMISNELDSALYREVIVHEIAHQWWYAVVGNDQIRHSWIDEGLSEYSTTLFFEFNPQYGISYADRMADKLTGYMMFLEIYGRRGELNLAMNRPLGEFSGGYEYMYIIYVQGALMFSSIRRMIGSEAFFAGLRILYERNFLGIARPEDVVGAFEEATGKPMASYIDTWLTGRVQMFAETPNARAA